MCHAAAGELLVCTVSFTYLRPSGVERRIPASTVVTVVGVEDVLGVGYVSVLRPWCDVIHMSIYYTDYYWESA